VGGRHPAVLPAPLIRQASRRGQSARRGGLAPQPPQNEAMEHQGQWDSKGWDHDQRIGCDEKVRRIKGKKMRQAGSGHRTHRNRHGEVGDAKNAPGIRCSASANRILRQERGHNDRKAAGQNVTNPRRQRELPRQVSAGPKHKEYAAPDAIDLSRHDEGQRYRGDEACHVF